MLIQAGGEVNKKTPRYSVTPLYLASLNGHVEVVEILIQAGGDVNIQTDASGFTPLHTASNNGDVEVITTLLAAGADKSIKTKSGKTPHDLARQKGNQDIVNALE